MPQKLEPEHLQTAHAWLGEIRAKLTTYAADDDELLFRMRRKLSRELEIDERGNAADRARVKKKLYRMQNGKCAFCGNAMELKGCHAHRIKAMLGYFAEGNVQLVHAHCHVQQQDEAGYT